MLFQFIKESECLLLREIGFERTHALVVVHADAAELGVERGQAPLDANTEGLMNAGAFAKMKKSAIFLNLGRGPIVVEKDLAEALKSGTIAAAGLDVLSAEPMRADNPLREIKDSDKLMITPHIAWASIEARTRLMKIIEGQIREFFHL